MSTTTKSPLRVVRNALAVGGDVFRLHAHRRCPKLYTQPQLFACLALKAFFKTDYRGIAQYLRDLPDLARAVGRWAEVLAGGQVEVGGVPGTGDLGALNLALR